MHTKIEKIKEFERLLDLMDILREKCPWDKEQTFESLRTLTIEETYELTDAILDENMEAIKKELGDLLLHVVFYAKMGSETKDFDLYDVCKSLNEKLIFRHPHIFSDLKVGDSETVMKNWESLKLQEKGGNKSVLGGVPVSLPALVKAHRIQDKVRCVGFDWKERTDVWEKIEEEFSELKTEIERLDRDKMEAEFGDLFFSLINAARLYDINPENALERTNRKFISRFNYLEEQAGKQKRSIRELTLEEMDKIWNEAKKKE